MSETTASFHNKSTADPLWVRLLFTTLALAFLALFLLVPLGIVFTEAFKKGLQVYLASLVDPDALSAIRLTLLIALITVPLNMVFGLAAAWAIGAI